MPENYIFFIGPAVANTKDRKVLNATTLTEFLTKDKHCMHPRFIKKKNKRSGPQEGVLKHAAFNKSV